METPNTLVVIDDRPSKAILFALEREGFTVFSATDGICGIKYVEDKNPDLVLIDICMPTMDGFEVLEYIKNKGLRTRVVMYSGVIIDIDTAIRCIKLGACDFIDKNKVPPLQLVKRLQKVLMMDNTLSDFSSKLPPSVEKLLQMNQPTNPDSKSFINRDLRTKLIALAFATGMVLTLRFANALQNGVQVIITLIILQVIFLFPIGKVADFYTKFGIFETRVKSKDHPAPKGEH